MSHNLILDALRGLHREFEAARPSQPAKSLLKAEVSKIADLVHALPDEDAPAAAAPTEAPATLSTADYTAPVSAITVSQTGAGNLRDAVTQDSSATLSEK